MNVKRQDLRNDQYALVIWAGHPTTSLPVIAVEMIAQDFLKKATTLKLVIPTSLFLRDFKRSLLPGSFSGISLSDFQIPYKWTTGGKVWFRLCWCLFPNPSPPCIVLMKRFNGGSKTVLQHTKRTPSQSPPVCSWFPFFSFCIISISTCAVGKSPACNRVWGVMVGKCIQQEITEEEGEKRVQKYLLLINL